MISEIVLLVIFSKPLYWAGRLVYSLLKSDYLGKDVYTANLMNWFSQAWKLIKWQKVDL